MAKKDLQWHTVQHSSQIEAVAHQDDQLFVQFSRSGGTYMYNGVPAEVFTELILAPSPGSYLASRVKGIYPYTRLS